MKGNPEEVQQFLLETLKCGHQRWPQNKQVCAGIQKLPQVNIEQMNEAAVRLLGTHNFAAFQSKGGRTSTIRTIHALRVSTINSEHGGGLRLVVEGNGFLYNMVRIIAGTLFEVGCGLRSLSQTTALILPYGELPTPPRVMA